MKTTLFISLCLISSSSFSQFSESFFESLNLGTSAKNCYGTEINNGALAVVFADSVDTEVQWAKLDLQGNYQTFSSHLPNDYISPNEHIIEVYESGINQFIVTQDSASNNVEGIRIHKFENYTQNVGLFIFPIELKGAYFQSYLKYGKIYVFVVDELNNFFCLKINPSTFIIEENLNLGNVSFGLQSTNSNYKRIHVSFQDENTMQLFTNSVSDLVRIKVINNVAQNIESYPLGISKVLGINESTQNVVCFKNGFFEVKKFQINFSDPLSSIILADSFNLSGINGPSFEVNYNNKDNYEVFSHSSKVYYLQNNLILSEKSYPFNSYQFSNVDFINNKPLFFGSRPLVTFDKNALFSTYGEISELENFKEYSGIYDFGDYNTRFCIGQNILDPINTTATGDFIFSSMVYASFYSISGKSNGEVFGENELYSAVKYKPGPYTNSNDYSHDIVHQYNENYYVDIDMMNYHVYAIANNLSTYSIPKGIRDWPAHGDVSKGQNANLAPFVDVNGNSIYEPLLGEYPSFPGTHCLLNITHQHENDFVNTGSGLELHSYMYNFTCEDSLDEVIFLKTDLFNHGSRNYDSLAVGIFSDFDLGGYSDDYIGTNVEKGLIYCFNGDAYDETSSGVLGFLDSLPTIGNLFLKGVKFDANGIDDNLGISTSQTVNGFGFNDGIIDNEYKGLEYANYFTGGGAPASQSDPDNTQQYYNYLNGLWRFGDTMVYGGTGFPGSPGSTSIRTKFAFPGDSDPLHYGANGIDPGFIWNEASNSNPVGDRRMIGSFGSGALNSGESMTHHSAMLAGKRIPGMGQSQIDLFAKSAYVRNAFNNNLTSCGQTFDNLTEDQVSSVSKIEKRKSIKMYPNPSNDKIFIDFAQFDVNSSISLCDINGKELLSQKMDNKLESVDISQLKNGIYFVKITSNSYSETVKLVKN